MQSAEEQEEVVEAYIEAEQAQGRIILAATPTEAQEMGIHCSPFGVIPKNHKPGKYRLILNLSAPEGNSVNDGIDREMASLSYVSVEEVAVAVAKLGRGALMAKNGYHAGLSPRAHPPKVLGMQWHGKVFVDATLPFGLRSAPLIFTAIADAAMWVIQQKGATQVFHYITTSSQWGHQPRQSVAETT